MPSTRSLGTEFACDFEVTNCDERLTQSALASLMVEAAQVGEICGK